MTILPPAVGTQLSADEAQTVEYYNNTDWKRPPGYWDPWVKRFMRYLSPGARVLEIGCGEAYPADLLHTRGFSYVGTDISSHFVELAQERDPSLEILNMTADALDFADESFGGWLALNVLQHIERQHLPAVMTETHRVLEPDAHAFCTVAHHPENNPFCSRLMWDKRSLGMESTRLFVFWQRADIERLFRAAGFQVIDYAQCVTNTAGVEGDSVHWHEFTLRAKK